jgi:hypothetical protein
LLGPSFFRLSLSSLLIPFPSHALSYERLGED